MKPATLLQVAWRESRFARRRLFLFLSAISLGVAALVAVKGFAANMEQGVRDESRALLGADVGLFSRQPFGPRSEALIDSLQGAGARVARVTSFASMSLLPRTGATRLVQVRAPEPGYPFYGTIETEPAGAWSRLHQGREAIVDPALLLALGAEVGDSLSLGQASFRIAGTLQRVPGDVEIASAFAPRVFIPAAHLPATGLVDFGSRVDYDAFVALPRPAEAGPFLEAHEPVFDAERVRTRSAQEQQENLTDALGDLTDYLGLIGVFALLLGGIGVASAMGAYMAQKVDTVAVLRCLGATARQVFAIYLVQAAAMGLAGALVGVVLGASVQWVLPRMLTGFLPVDVRVTLDGVSIVTGILVGIWTAVVFALIPLLQIRTVSPLGALRRRVERLDLPGRDWVRLGAWGALAASVLLLLVLQVDDLEEGAGLAAGVGVTVTLLWLAAQGVTRGVRRLPRAGIGYTVRQGLANLHRPGNQTRTVVLALGFGVFLLGALYLTQSNILAPLEVGDPAARPNLVLWDVQEDQEPGVREILAQRGLPVLQAAPIVPMRVAAINGVGVERWLVRDPTRDEPPPAADGEEDPERWAVRREYRSTYSDTLTSSETLLEGEWWDGEATPAEGPFPVSLEQDIARDLAVGVGDRIDWDVQGVIVPSVVTSIRRVDWARFQPNFFAVFHPQGLRGAPQSWVVMSRAADAAERAQVQRALVERFPNVSALDLTQVQGALDEVIARISTVIRFLAAFSVATGFIVLLGAISTSRLQRMRESVLLKTLGATRRQIGAILLTEYLLLGVLASLVGLVLSIGAGWALARWLFEVPFGVEPLPLLGLAAAVAALAAAVGLWASQEVFRSTPLEAIREE